MNFYLSFVDFDKEETVTPILNLVKYRKPHRKQTAWPNYSEKVPLRNSQWNVWVR